MISRDEPPSPLEQLPDEMLLHTLSFFNKKELGSIAPVNKNFNCLVNISFNDRRLDYTQPQLDQIRNFEGNKNFDWVKAIWLSDTEIASGSTDNSVKIWDANTQKCLKTLLLPYGVTCIKKFDNQLLIGTSGGAIYKCDYQLEQPATCIRNSNNKDSFITTLIKLPDKILFSTSQYLKILDLKSAQEQKIISFHISHPRPVQLADGTILVNTDKDCSCEDKAIIVRPLLLPPPQETNLRRNNINSVIALPEKRIAIGDSLGYLFLLDLAGKILLENEIPSSQGIQLASAITIPFRSQVSFRR